jgi:hypothetical protein
VAPCTGDKHWHTFVISLLTRALVLGLPLSRILFLLSSPVPLRDLPIIGLLGIVHRACLSGVRLAIAFPRLEHQHHAVHVVSRPLAQSSIVAPSSLNKIRPFRLVFVRVMAVIPHRSHGIVRRVVAPQLARVGRFCHTIGDTGKRGECGGSVLVTIGAFERRAIGLDFARFRVDKGHLERDKSFVHGVVVASILRCDGKRRWLTRFDQVDRRCVAGRGGVEVVLGRGNSVIQTLGGGRLVWREDQSAEDGSEDGETVDDISKGISNNGDDTANTWQRAEDRYDWIEETTSLDVVDGDGMRTVSAGLGMGNDQTSAVLIPKCE